MSELSAMDPELGREVEIGRIDKELRKLWDEDEARTNASLMNLAIYTERSEELVEISKAVRGLTREHACRALLIGIDRDAPETSIRAWMTAHCHLAHGHKSICCEQLAFKLTGRATGRLRNTVFAHLNSDLPLILMWNGELSPRFDERLYSLVDRFVFDSSEWRQDALASFDRIREAMENSPRLVVQDLEWTRSNQFRFSVAALFDDPLAQAALGAIEAVEIRHHPRHRCAALQLLAWIAEQSRWREGGELALADDRQHDGRQSFSFEHREGGAVTAVLVADDHAAPIGELRMTAGETRIEVSRDAGAKHVCRRLSAPGHVTESLVPADPDGSMDLLGDQLARGGRNSLFRKILTRFLRLMSA